MSSAIERAMSSSLSAASVRSMSRWTTVRSSSWDCAVAATLVEIRQALERFWPARLARTPILYGGSVTPDNVDDERYPPRNLQLFINSSKEAGLRGVLGQTIIEFPVADAKTPDEGLARAEAFLKEVVRLRPSSAKGTYVRSVTLSTTMGPAVPVDRTVAAGAAR